MTPNMMTDEEIIEQLKALQKEINKRVLRKPNWLNAARLMHGVIGALLGD